MEDRVARLEDRVSSLEVAAGKIDTSSEHLAKTVDQLSAVVQDLRDTMNQGRGALWAITAAAGVAGGAVALMLKRFLGVA